MLKLLLGPFLLWLLLVPRHSVASPAVDYLGIQSRHWNCEASLNAVKNLPEIRATFLYNTFGKSFDCLDKLVRLPNFKAIKIHLINGPCRRSNRCGRYELLPNLRRMDWDARLQTPDAKTIAAIERYVRRAALWVHSIPPEVEIFISPELESDLGKRAGTNLMAIVKPWFPTAKFVWNPVGYNRARIRNADFLEKHGQGVKGDVVSLDGDDIGFHKRPCHPMAPCVPEDNVPYFLGNNEEAVFAGLWVREFNCVLSPQFSDPRTRTGCKSPSVFRLAQKLLEEAFKAPVHVPDWTPEDNLSLEGCASFGRAPDGRGGFLLKQSDVHPGAVVILPNGEKIVRALSLVSKGSVVTRFQYQGGPGFPDPRNGKLRAIYRSKRRSISLPFNSVLKAGARCWVISNPKVRVD